MGSPCSNLALSNTAALSTSPDHVIEHDNKLGGETRNGSFTVPESRNPSEICLDQSARHGNKLAGCSLNHEQRCIIVVDRFRRGADLSVVN